jgi:transposase
MGLVDRQRRRLQDEKTSWKLKARRIVGRTALVSIKHSIEMCNVSRSVAKYWKKKTLDPSWKRKSHGGWRRGYTAEQTRWMVEILKEIVSTRPASPYRYYTTAILRKYGIRVSTSWVKRTFQDIGWTYVPRSLSPEKNNSAPDG